MCPWLAGVLVTLAQTFLRIYSVTRSSVSHARLQLEVVWQCPSLGLVEEEQVEMGSREVVLEEKPFDQCRSLRQIRLPAPDDPERLGSGFPAQVPLLVLPHCRSVEERARIH